MYKILFSLAKLYPGIVWNLIQGSSRNAGDAPSKKKKKKNSQAFLGINNYLSNLSPRTANIYEVLRQLTSVKLEWTWNTTCQELFDKTKSIIKEDAYVKFYDETKPLYLEMDASGVRLGAILLQTRNGTSCSRDVAPENSILRPITFASKSLSSTEKRYSNIGRKGPNIIHALEKFHCYYFTRDVSIITGHKPLVAIFNNIAATLSQRLQWILFRIHQNRVRIICKADPDLMIADWLSRQNHKENKNEEITGMQVNINTVETTTNIPECMIIWNCNGKYHKTTTYNSWQNKSSKDGHRIKIT